MENEIDMNVNTGTESDGSVSWEDFFGTSTDLVPQLLGMFDELARKAEDREQIPTIQKRLSLVAQQRNSIFGHSCANSQRKLMQEQQQVQSTDASKSACSRVEITVCNAERDNESTPVAPNDDKSMYHCEMTTGLVPEYGRRRKHLDRPLSGSSIASSTSSSACSNQGNACSANPYLASVESLADTCASSQGSADSGVMKTEASCSVESGENEERSHIEDSPLLYHRARYCDPQRNSVERVLLEIVDTEAVYVAHLRQVIQGYLIFWRDDPAGLLQQLELNHLFSNIEDIFRFNSEFLKEIEACGLDPLSVAQTFTKHNAGFKVYTEYCTNYPRTVSVLTDLMSRDNTAKAFRERQAALGHALPLGSFLLKPVQRILKYHLLLENLSKEYEADGKRKDMKEDTIEEALAAMTGIAKHINAMKRRHEHAVRVQEIQSLLYGWPGPDLTTSGELIAEGRFRMRGAKAPRHAFLFERMLLLTKKKVDGVLVYKAHIMCSNLMLIESIPGEPCSFHVIPFDNPRLQYTLQARNLEQKREWTLQIKRVMLENYNAVIPIHARQLVLQLGQTQHQDDTINDRVMKKMYTAPPEYLKRRRIEKERRRSEAGLRQKKKVDKTDNSALALDNLPLSSRKSQVEESSSQDPSLNRSLDSGRAAKVRDRFTSWRRKSEPGFQSYVSFDQSDDEEKCQETLQSESLTQIDAINVAAIEDNSSNELKNIVNNSMVADTKDINETQVRTVEEIVGHILMQNQEFQRLLEKQRTNSLANVRQQRFKKHQRSVDTSDDSDNAENYSAEFSINSHSNNVTNSNNHSHNNINNNNNNINNNNNNNNSRNNRSIRNLRRDHRFVWSNNARNSLSPPSRENEPNLQLQYNNLRTDTDKSEITSKNKVNRVAEKKAVFEAFKRPSIMTESKIIKTALRLRENSVEEKTCQDNEKIEESHKEDKKESSNEGSNFGNYDNLQHIWKDMHERPKTGNDSPTRPAVWLTKLCENLPTSPLKSGSLPRSFQIPNPQVITKTRFLQRDGKPLSERPFTIASDKPGEINLEDMERYATSYQPEGKIAKFPILASSTSSSFFCSLEDNLTDVDSDIQSNINSTTIHPDHKIYRAHISGSTMLKNVLSKAGSRLQGLRSTVSAETLECTDFDSRKSSSLVSSSSSSSAGNSNIKLKKKKMKSRLSSRESLDIDEPTIGCISKNNSFLQSSSLYYKQGSSGLGARIAQADYADPSVLFFDIKRSESNNANVNDSTASVNTSISNVKEADNNDENINSTQRLLSDGENFYEKCFESIEDYVDETDDAFRDSAIFSDTEDISSLQISAIDIYNSNKINNSHKNSSNNNNSNNSNNSSHNSNDYSHNIRHNTNMPIAINKQKVAPPVPIKRKPKECTKLSLMNSNACEQKNVEPNIVKITEKFGKLHSSKSESDRDDKSSASFKISVPKKVISMYPSINKPSINPNNEDNSDISAGQSQAGWVKKMIGQLQAQIETL